MITIFFNQQSVKIQDWEEKLKELVVAYRLEEDATLEVPILTEKDQRIKGATAIDVYLHQLEKDIIEWRKPGCGK